MHLSEQTINFLNANRPHYDLLIKAQMVKHLDGATRQGLLNAAREFSPDYMADLWCGTCVADLIKRTYEWYDIWLKQQVTKMD